jgi:hypothetical protein
MNEIERHMDHLAARDAKLAGIERHRWIAGEIKQAQAELERLQAEQAELSDQEQLQAAVETEYRKHPAQAGPGLARATARVEHRETFLSIVEKSIADAESRISELEKEAVDLKEAVNNATVLTHLRA